jgi:hypothetical protein
MMMKKKETSCKFTICKMVEDKYYYSPGELLIAGLAEAGLERTKDNISIAMSAKVGEGTLDQFLKTANVTRVDGPVPTRPHRSLPDLPHELSLVRLHKLRGGTSAECALLALWESYYLYNPSGMEEHLLNISPLYRDRFNTTRQSFLRYLGGIEMESYISAAPIGAKFVYPRLLNIKLAEPRDDGSHIDATGWAYALKKHGGDAEKELGKVVEAAKHELPRLRVTYDQLKTDETKQAFADELRMNDEWKFAVGADIAKSLIRRFREVAEEMDRFAKNGTFHPRPALVARRIIVRAWACAMGIELDKSAADAIPSIAACDACMERMRKTYEAELRVHRIRKDVAMKLSRFVERAERLDPGFPLPDLGTEERFWAGRFTSTFGDLLVTLGTVQRVAEVADIRVMFVEWWRSMKTFDRYLPRMRGPPGWDGNWVMDRMQVSIQERLEQSRGAARVKRPKVEEEVSPPNGPPPPEESPPPEEGVLPPNGPLASMELPHLNAVRQQLGLERSRLQNSKLVPSRLKRELGEGLYSKWIQRLGEEDLGADAARYQELKDDFVRTFVTATGRLRSEPTADDDILTWIDQISDIVLERIHDEEMMGRFEALMKADSLSAASNVMEQYVKSVDAAKTVSEKLDVQGAFLQKLMDIEQLETGFMGGRRVDDPDVELEPLVPTYRAGTPVQAEESAQGYAREVEARAKDMVGEERWHDHQDILAWYKETGTNGASEYEEAFFKAAGGEPEDVDAVLNKYATQQAEMDLEATTDEETASGLQRRELYKTRTGLGLLWSEPESAPVWIEAIVGEHRTLVDLKVGPGYVRKMMKLFLELDRDREAVIGKIKTLQEEVRSQLIDDITNSKSASAFAKDMASSFQMALIQAKGKGNNTEKFLAKAHKSLSEFTGTDEELKNLLTGILGRMVGGRPKLHDDRFKKEFKEAFSSYVSDIDARLARREQLDGAVEGEAVGRRKRSVREH